MLKGWKPGADLVVFCVFDILVFEGRKVMDRPLNMRRDLLKELLTKVELSVLPVGYTEEAVNCSTSKPWRSSWRASSRRI